MDIFDNNPKTMYNTKTEEDLVKSFNIIISKPIITLEDKKHLCFIKRAAKRISNINYDEFISKLYEHAVKISSDYCHTLYPFSGGKIKKRKSMKKRK